jgi:hypothetical protein
VLAAVHAGDSWYVGGEFTGVQTNPAASLVVLDASGFEADDCRVGAGFNGPVFAIAVTDDAAYVGGDFTEYRGQRIRSLAKLDARTCALDTRFSPPPGPPGFEGHVRELAVFGGGSLRRTVPGLQRGDAHQAGPHDRASPTRRSRPRWLP